MKILFGVFDWGFGHATRDTPIIQELLKRKNEIHIISTGNALKLLRNKFGNKCSFYDIPSTAQLYSKKGSFQVNFVISLPSILGVMRKARVETKKIIDKEKFDIVISDCRYDVYDSPSNSYLINHQLRFVGPFGTETILEKWLASQMKHYKYIFVPDFSKNNLSGRLSHNLKYVPASKIKYIGILSHVKKKKVKQDIDYFISLSGPEQTRIDLERKIFSQLNVLKGKVVIAGGNIRKDSKKLFSNVEFYSFLDSQQQEDMMNRAKFLIIRSGYTTIMELAELDKSALLIPSPTQTEQEYLGEYLLENKFFYSVSQEDLDLSQDLKDIKDFPGFKPPWKTKESVKKIINLLKN